MDALLHREGFRAFDIGLFAEPLRQRIRDNAVALGKPPSATHRRPSW
jgi:hypothetical protein